MTPRPRSLLLALALAGCAPGPRPEPEVARPIEAEPDPGPRRREDARPPRLAPPPARGRGLDEQEVVALVRRHEDPQDAIDALDARRLAFALDQAALDRLAGEGVGPEVLDYLRKRARVDWEALRGDVDPDAAPGED